MGLPHRERQGPDTLHGPFGFYAWFRPVEYGEARAQASCARARATSSAGGLAQIWIVGMHPVLVGTSGRRIPQTRQTGSAQSKLSTAFDFLALTAARSKRVRLGPWNEIDPIRGVSLPTLARPDARLATFGSRQILAGEIPSAKKHQPAVSCSLLILIRGVASFLGTRSLCHCSEASSMLPVFPFPS